MAIMESGRIVEQGDVLTVFSNPQHPVTERFVKQVASEDDSIETVEHLIKKFPKGNCSSEISKRKSRTTFHHKRYS